MPTANFSLVPRSRKQTLWLGVCCPKISLIFLETQQNAFNFSYIYFPFQSCLVLFNFLLTLLRLLFSLIFGRCPWCGSIREMAVVTTSDWIITILNAFGNYLGLMKSNSTISHNILFPPRWPMTVGLWFMFS